MVVKTKKVERNNKNKVGGVRSSESKSDGNVLVIYKVYSAPKHYFKESQEEVNKLLTVGNRIISIKVKYSDKSTETFTFDNDLTTTDFKKQFRILAHLGDDELLKDAQVTLEIENNFMVPNKTTRKAALSNPRDSVTSSTTSKSMEDKLRLLVIKTLSRKIKNKGTLTLDLKKIKTFVKMGDSADKSFRFYFGIHSGFDVALVPKYFYERILRYKKSNRSNKIPSSVKSDPGHKIKRRSIRKHVSSTKSAE